MAAAADRLQTGPQPARRSNVITSGATAAHMVATDVPVAGARPSQVPGAATNRRVRKTRRRAPEVQLPRHLQDGQESSDAAAAPGEEFTVTMKQVCSIHDGLMAAVPKFPCGAADLNPHVQLDLMYACMRRCLLWQQTIWRTAIA